MIDPSVIVSSAQTAVKLLMECINAYTAVPKELQEFKSKLEAVSAFTDEQAGIIVLITDLHSRPNMNKGDSFMSRLADSVEQSKDLAEKLHARRGHGKVGAKITDFFGTIFGAGAQAQLERLKSMTETLDKCINDITKQNEQSTAKFAALTSINTESIARDISSMMQAQAEPMRIVSMAIKNQNSLNFWVKYFSTAHQIQWNVFKNCLLSIVDPFNKFTPEEKEVFNKSSNQLKELINSDGDNVIDVYEYGRSTRFYDIFQVLETIKIQYTTEVSTNPITSTTTTMTTMTMTTTRSTVPQPNGADNTGGASTVSGTDEKGNTPLHNAALLGDKREIKNLIAQKADVKAVNKLQMTPLFCAATSGNKEIMLELYNARASVFATTTSGATALHTAAENGHKDVVAELVHLGAKVNMSDNDGNTPFNLAMQKNQIDTAKVLLDLGAEVNLKAFLIGQQLKIIHLSLLPAAQQPAKAASLTPNTKKRFPFSLCGGRPEDVVVPAPAPVNTKQEIASDRFFVVAKQFCEVNAKQLFSDCYDAKLTRFLLRVLFDKTYTTEEGLESVIGMLSILCYNSGNLTIFVDELGIEELVSILNRDCTEAQASLACKTLSTICLTEEYRAPVEKKGGIAAILSVMRRFAGDAQLLLQGCSALWNSAVRDENQLVIYNGGGIDLLLSSIKKFKNDAAIKKNAFGVLWNLAAHPTLRPVLRSKGILQTLVDACENDKVDVATVALRVLGNMSIEDESKKELMSLKGTQAVLTAMKRSASDCVVHTQGCRVLWNLTLGNDNAMVAIDNNGFNIVLDGMIKHKNDQTAVTNSLAVFWNISEVPEQRPLIGKNLTDHIFEALNRFKDVEIINDKGLAVLWNTAVHKDMKPLLREKGVLDVITACMKRHRESVDVQRKGCGAMSSLSFDADNKAAIGNKGGIQLIISALNKHKDSTLVCEKAFSALWNLSFSSDDNVKIIGSEGLNSLVEGIKNPQLNTTEVVMENAFGALGNMILKNEWKTAAKANGAKAAVSAVMTRFPNSKNIQTSGNTLVQGLI